MPQYASTRQKEQRLQEIDAKLHERRELSTEQLGELCKERQQLQHKLTFNDYRNTRNAKKREEAHLADEAVRKAQADKAYMEDSMKSAYLAIKERVEAAEAVTENTGSVIPACTHSWGWDCNLCCGPDA